MLKNKNKIDELFNDFLYDYKEEAPNFVWNNLKTELKIKKRLRVLYQIKAVAATVALLITFGLGYSVSDLKISKIGKAKTLRQDIINIFSNKTPRLSGDSLNTNETDDLPDKKFVVKQKEDLQKYATDLKKTDLKFRIANYEKIRIYDTNQLYRKYQINNEFFVLLNKEYKKNEILALNSLSGQKSNQLLTDTLLLEKENLPEGGFLLQKEDKKVSAWSFGTKFSPIFLIGNNSSSEDANVNEGIKSSVKSNAPNVNAKEKPLTSYSGGLNINYHVSRRLVVESGIYYSQRKQGADNLIGSQDTEFGGNDFTVYTPGGMRTVEPTVDGSVLRSAYSTTYYSLNANFVSNAEYIELPLILRYKLVDQKISLDVMSGVSTNFLVNNSSTIQSGDQKLWSGQNSDLSSVLYGATVGLGVNYNFYQNFAFNLEPTLKYSILPESSILRKYPYSFAVFAGFSYRFK